MTTKTEPTMIDAAYWRTHRCPWCGSPGMFTHMMRPGVLWCDACDVQWSPEHVGRRIAEVLGGFVTLVRTDGTIYGAPAR